MFQGTQNYYELPVCCVIILLRHRQLVGQVLHWQPLLRVIILLYQHGADSVVTGVHPDFVRLVFVEHLQDRGTGEGFFQLLKGGFFFSSPREVFVLPSQVSHRLSNSRKALHESPVEVHQPRIPCTSRTHIGVGQDDTASTLSTASFTSSADTT